MSPVLQAEFAAFQARHPLQECMIDAVRWSYLDAGHGHTLVMLPGFFGVAGTDFQYMLAFEPDFRVISLSYPEEISSIAGLVDGLAGFLDGLGLAKAHLLGGSYSGYVAQAFVRRYPGRVGKLILAQTGAPRRRHVPLALALASLFAVTPQPVLRGWMRRVAAYFLPQATPPQIFWRAYFFGLINTFSRRAIYHRFRVVLDYHSRYCYTPADLSGWGGEILLLESDGDRMLSREDTLLTRHLYPRAQRASLPGDHVQSVDRPSEQIACIAKFLREGV